VIVKIIEENFIKVIERKFVEIKIPCVPMSRALDLDLPSTDCEPGELQMCREETAGYQCLNTYATSSSIFYLFRYTVLHQISGSINQVKLFDQNYLSHPKLHYEYRNAETHPQVPVSLVLIHCKP
jgi:hypothetical protein